MHLKLGTIQRRRLLAIIWGMIFLSTALIVGNSLSTPSSYLPDGSSGAGLAADAEYVGPETCGLCHAEVFDSWNATPHATPVSYVYDNREGDACWSCHVNGTNYETLEPIGQDLLGFTATNDPVYEGISCETCHGPYQGGAGPEHMPKTVEAELCGECHSPYHGDGHGDAYAYWSQSGHAHANETLIEGGFEQPRCVQCHTDGALPWPPTGEARGEGFVDHTDDSTTGVTCAVCHDPHSEENDHQLREATVPELCMTCHSHETETAPHLSRTLPDVLNETSGEVLEEGEQATCATCHMFGETISRGNLRQVTNHTMGVWEGACEQCHSDPDQAWERMEELLDMGADRMAEAMSAVEGAHAAYEAANTTAGADAMKLAEAESKLAELDDLEHEIDLSGTLAFHDAWQLEEMIDEAIAEATEIIHLSKDAMSGKATVTVTDKVTTTVSEHGLQLLAVLGFSVAILVAALRRRRA